MASLVNPLEAAWAVLLKLDPHEEEEPYLNMYMQGQDKANREMYGDPHDEESSLGDEEDMEDIVTNPFGVPKRDVQLNSPKPNLDSNFNLEQHALENAIAHAKEQEAMGAGKFNQPSPKIPEEEKIPEE